MSEQQDRAQRPTIGKVALCRALKTTVPTLDIMIAEDPEFPIVEQGGRGRSYQFDLKAVQEHLARRRQEKADREREQAAKLAEGGLGLGDTGEDSGTIAFSPAQRAAMARARRDELKLRREAGQLVVVSELRFALEEAFERLGSKFDSLPEVMARRFNLSPAVVHAMAEFLDDARRQMVDDIEASMQGGEELEGMGGGRRRAAGE